MRHAKLPLAALVLLLSAGCLSGGDQRDAGGGEEESTVVDPYSDAGTPTNDDVPGSTDAPGAEECIDTTTGEPAEGFHNPCPQGEYPTTGG